jgi:integrase
MACIKRRRGRWVVDFRDQNSKRHWKTFRTRKAADDALSDLTRDVREGLYRDPATLPAFEQVARAWLEVKRDHPPSTFHYWQRQVERHFLPAFGTLRIDRVTPGAIEALRNAKRDGTNGHERLARVTINQLLQTLTAILEYAVEHGELRANPGKRVKRVRRERRAAEAGPQAVDPRDVLTADQAGRLIEAAEPGLYRTFIKTALLTGCRSGELLALTWDRVDLERGALRVDRSLAWVPGAERGYGKSTPVLGPPKTDSSYRTLEMAPDLVHDLKVWRLQSRYSKDEDCVFANSLGKPLHRAFLHKGLRAALGRCADLPHVDVHGLRHSFASIMIGLGKPVTQVAKILGHKNSDITLKVYSHWFKGESSATAMSELAAAVCQPAGGSRVVAKW